MAGNPEETARVFPRPVSELDAVSTTESARTRIAVGTKVGKIKGGSLTRRAGGAGLEESVSVALWRADSTEDGDFIDRFDVEIEASGPESGQGSFHFAYTEEFSSSAKGLWFTLTNSIQGDENWTMHLDIIPGVAWPEDA